MRWTRPRLLAHLATASWQTRARETQFEIYGAGISGLSLAWHLRERGFAVTVIDRRSKGGQKIPLVNAGLNHTTRPLKDTIFLDAVNFVRSWYAQFEEWGERVLLKNDEAYTIHSRRFLLRLKHALSLKGVVFKRVTQNSAQYIHADIRLVTRITVIATNELSDVKLKSEWASSKLGEAMYADIGRRIEPQMDEILSRIYLVPKFQANSKGDKFSARIGGWNYFSGHRLITRDRHPLMGFAVKNFAEGYDALFSRFQKNQHKVFEETFDLNHFQFTAMGYHAFSLAPYLAYHAAAIFAGERNEKSMFLCGRLSPIRFLK